MVEDLLGKDLAATSVQSANLIDKDGSVWVEAILVKPTRYVAQVGEDKSFIALIDRQLLLEEVVENFLREAEGSETCEAQ